MNNDISQLITEKDPSHTLLIVSCVMLFTILIISTHYTYQTNQLFTENEKIYIRLDNIDALLVHVLRLETSANRYLLSRNETHLAFFDKSLEDINNVMSVTTRDWIRSINENKVYDVVNDINLLIDNTNLMVKSEDISDAFNKTKVSENSTLTKAISVNLTKIRKNLSDITKAQRKEELTNVRKIEWFMIVLCFIAVSLLLTSYLILKRRRKIVKTTALAMAQQNTVLESEVNERTRELASLAAYLTNYNENEKRRIARDLHDELGALLTAARMDTSWIMRNLQPKDKEHLNPKLERLSDSLNSSIALKRQIISSLVPPLLQELGLVDAIEAMTEEEDMHSEQRTHYICNLDRNLPKISSNKELALFRICQESLTNIKKYAKANLVTINLRQEEGMICLKIEDNGLGFDSETKNLGTHGIAGMRSRTAMFGGKFYVQSKKGHGTTIEAKIPIN